MRCSGWRRHLIMTARFPNEFEPEAAVAEDQIHQCSMISQK
jgi:hypothetical protein